MPMHVCTCTKEFGEAEFEDEDSSEYTTYFRKQSRCRWRDFSSLEHSTSPSSLPASVTLHCYLDLGAG
eukprot:scaffold14092_cov226-Skeletonema_dohrnii-CCMP3373.AAC.2